MRRAIARLRMIAAILGIVVAAAVGGATGIAVGERASQPEVHDLVVSDPRNAPEHALALRSPAGFTGFEGRPGLTGRVFRAGQVDTATEGALAITAEGGRVDVRLRDGTRLFSLAPLTGELRAGDIVLARVEDDVVTGILRVPPDLGEGEGRSQRLPPGPRD